MSGLVNSAKQFLSARGLVRAGLTATMALVLAACTSSGDKPAPAPQRPAAPDVTITPPPQTLPGRNTTGFLKPRHLDANEPVRVALLVPLSGGAAPVGEAMLNAAQLALFEFDDPNILLIPKDTGGDPAKAAQVSREAISEGADIILGPLFANSGRRSPPVCRSLPFQRTALSRAAGSIS